MTINKRACRKYYDPGLTIPASNGLLCVKQVQYIVRTAIKNIGESRLLVLYLYAREKAAERKFRPAFTLYQGKDDFATLAQGDDGSLKWRTTSFDNINREYNFDKKCTFYSSHDEERVTRFCAITDKKGFQALDILQSSIRSAQELKRRHQKQRTIIERMRVLVPLPRDFKGWIHREVLPHYIFYSYAKGKKLMDGYCTCCKHEVQVTEPKHNAEGTCPRCKSQVTLKSRGKRGYINDRSTVQILQKISDKELVIRIYKVYCHYYKTEISELNIYEATRIFVNSDSPGKCTEEPYHHSFDCGDLTPWKQGYCPVYYVYQQNFSAEVCGHLYHRNLDEVLSGTPWQYSQLKLFYLKEKTQMTTITYLRALTHTPKLEVLFKLGFYRLTSDLIYRDNPAYLLDCSKKKPHEILQVWPEDVNDLRNNHCRTGDLKEYQKYREKGISSKTREEIYSWLNRYNLRNDHDVLALMSRMTLHKLFRYAEEQLTLLHSRKTDQGDTRYESMGSILNEYRDYLRMCEQQNYDMKNSFILYPRDLQQTHDRLSARIQAKLDAKQRRSFIAAYRSIVAHLDFEMEGLTIVYPQKPEDIEAEGNSLHHCVGSYTSRVAEKKCIILFLRQTANPEKSFYTIEVRDHKVAQVRGMQNCAPTPEVKQFMGAWESEVLHRTKLPVAA